jgi:hypothetical protein
MTKECEERNYKGWTNYETWAVSLWLDNEEPSYRHWTGRARWWKGREDAASRLAEELKEELQDGNRLGEPSVYGDLLSAALSGVNWQEIAEGYLDAVGDADGADQETTPEDSDAKGLFGEVISAYTRRQAIADGELVDVTEMAQEAGFRIPVGLTRAAWVRCVQVPEGVEGQDESGRLWDVLWMCRSEISRKSHISELLFQLHVRDDNREGGPPLVTLRAVCGTNDDGSPCLTILLPDED